MNRLLTLLAAIVGISVVILSVSCEGGEIQEAGQITQPADQPQQGDPPDQPAVEQQAEQQPAPPAAEQVESQQETAEEQAEPAPLPNRAPIANAGPDGSHDLTAGSVLLDGSSSGDPDGDSLTYEWTQVGGLAVSLRQASSGSPEARFNSPRTEQTLTFQLRVTDESEASSTDAVTLHFVNAPPTAQAGTNQDAGRGQEVQLRGWGNDDANGMLSYSWSQVSGPAVELSDATAASPVFTAPNEFGVLVFSLSVSDGEHESAPDTVTITIRNLAPVAKAGVIQTVAHSARVTLDGGGSFDPDGDGLTYRWTQISGDEVILNNSEAAKPSFTAPQEAQSLIFRLEVSDGSNSATDTVRIMVTYEPIVASNFETANQWTTVFYEAKEDAFTGDVRTDVRMRGPDENLLIDVVCFENGNVAIGFRLLDFVRPGRDADVPRELEVMWRLNDGAVLRETLEVTFLGDTPTIYFQGREFEEDWPQVLDGGKLAVRIGYRGVHEEVFDLDAFAKTPVHLNLVNCGSY